MRSALQSRDKNFEMHFWPGLSQDGVTAWRKICESIKLVQYWHQEYLQHFQQDSTLCLSYEVVAKWKSRCESVSNICLRNICKISNMIFSWIQIDCVPYTQVDHLAYTQNCVKSGEIPLTLNWQMEVNMWECNVFPIFASGIFESFQRSPWFGLSDEGLPDGVE